MQTKRIQPIHPVASLQPPYSMLVRSVENGLLDFCAANPIGVVVYSPMQKGLLTGKFQERARSMAEDDHRRQEPDFQEPRLTAHLQLVESLRPIAAKHGKTVAHLAIAWVLRCPQVTSAIVGARHAAQVEETVAGGDWVLSAEDIRAIDVLLGEHQQAFKQG